MTSKFLMHKDNMDVCFQVMGPGARGDDSKTFYYSIFLGYDGKPRYLQDMMEPVIADVKDFEGPQWTQLTELDLYKKRTKSGIPK